MAQSKIAQQKEKDFDDVVPREGFSQMSEEDQEVCVAAAREACKKHHDGEFKYYKTMAIYIKEQLDKKLGGSWHIIVGKLQLLISISSRTFRLRFANPSFSHLSLR